MPKLIICTGIPGSGKSHFANAWVKEDSNHRVRFNYDDLRNMMGTYWVPSREHMLSALKAAFLEEATSKGYDIVIDNMNLNPKEIKYYEQYINYFNFKHPEKEYIIEYKNFDTPLKVCIERDSKREQPIGEKVITQIYERYKKVY